MALKAGYRGVKKSFLDIINSIKLITSIGDGLDFDSGELSIETGEGLSFDEDGKITVDLGDGLDFDEDGKITADLGDGLDFDEDGKITVTSTGTSIKTLTYTGDGTNTSTIDFSNEDELPSVILGICGESDNSYYSCSTTILYGVQLRAYCYWSQPTGNKNGSVNIVSYTDNNTKMHIAAINSGEALNNTGKTYTVYYI